MLHAQLININGVNFSNNGSIYTVLRQTTGAITSDPATGSNIATWPIVGTSAPITTASNGIVPILTGVASNPLTRVDPNQEVRFAYVINDTLLVRGTPGFSLTTPPVVPSPATFTVNGVTLQSVDQTNFIDERVRYGRYPDFRFNNV